MAEHEESEGGSDFGFIVVCIVVLVLAWLLSQQRETTDIDLVPRDATSTPPEIRTAPNETNTSVQNSEPNSSFNAEPDTIDEIEQRIREIEAEIHQIEREKRKESE